ncbi:MAG: DUF2855 family protein [Woeseiaceae bacterium]|nr:DUF2855 family protein [Woeseiaceae bacterium]
MTQKITAQTLEVRRDEWPQTRILTETLSSDLAADAVLLRIEHFALTANNISYAATGDSLGYWQFFPAENGWGRIPVMGWGTVLASKHPDISSGERVSGFFPMSTHLSITAGGVTASQFADVSEHRANLAPFYAVFQRAAAIPDYDTGMEGHDSLLRNLFATGWLVEDYLHELADVSVGSCLISSASSKTSISLGHCVKARGELRSIGITSAGNVAFCENVGCYDEVVSYEDITDLDASRAIAFVDMAGSARLTASLHEHFGDNMKVSTKVGATHYDQAAPLDQAVDNLPGAKPAFFFAPTQFQRVAEKVGPGELQKRLSTAYAGFRENAVQWLEIQRGSGPEAVESAYQAVLAGKANPAHGLVLSMWNTKL